MPLCRVTETIHPFWGWDMDVVGAHDPAFRSDHRSLESFVCSLPFVWCVKSASAASGLAAPSMAQGLVQAGALHGHPVNTLCQEKE